MEVKNRPQLCDTAWLFNSDFESKLFSRKLNNFESSKMNQEFEFFIHLLEPEKTIFTSKTYSRVYKEYLYQLTGHSLKKTLKAKVIKNWCQDSTDYELLTKLQNKFITAQFCLDHKLWNHRTQFVNNEQNLQSDFLYKRPDGLSGGGHYKYPLHKKKIVEVIKKYGRILEEEILVRNKDFSTLVENGKQVAIYENYIDDYFQYKGSSFSSKNILTEEETSLHQKNLAIILKHTEDYQGIMSIDGFTYKDHLNSICEINARKTMGHTAFKLWKIYFSKKSEFKLLLIKNDSFKYTHKEVSKKFSGNLKLISPLSNRFLVFIFAADSQEELFNIERMLVTTLF